MVDTPWGPLPDAAGEYPVRRGKFIDVEVIGSLSAGGSLSGGTITGSTISGGTIVAADIYSDNWDGNIPLSSLPNAGASAGYALDGSAGAAQFLSIYAEGGQIGNLSIVDDLYSSNWNGTTPLSLPDSGASAGFALDGSAGTAQFQSMYAEGGTLVDLSVSGTLEMASAGLIKTGATGSVRIELTGDSGSNDWVSWVNSSNSTYASLRGNATSSRLDIYTTGDLWTFTGGQSFWVTSSGDLRLRLDGGNGNAGYFMQGNASGGSLYLQNSAADQDIFLRTTSSSGPTTVNRVQVDANGGTLFYPNSGSGTYALGVYELSGVSTWAAEGTTNNSMRWDSSVNQVAIYINSTQELLLGNTGFNVQNVYDVDANAASQQPVYVNNDGRLHIDTSTLRNKPDWSDASGLAAITLRPIAFTKDGVPSLGFGAEHLAEEDDRLVSYDAEGLPLNYRDRAVLAVLAAKVNRLERTILNAV